MKRKQGRSEEGFTIIELLIATTVFTLVLILLTTGVLAVTRMYYKGIVTSQTQTAARNIVDTITQSLQFSSASFSSTPINGSGFGGFCIGADQYSYQLGQEVADSSTPVHALLERNVGNSCSTTPLITTPTSSPVTTELLSDHMRLDNLDVAAVPSTPGLYCVSIRIIYGDSGLLSRTTPSAPSSDSCSGYSGHTYQQHQCNGAFDQYASGQFCAVSGLDTYVQERV